MFPNAHTKSISDVSIKSSAKSFHASYLEIINPSSDELVQLLYFIAIANAPIACGPAPDGRARWTLRLLEKQVRLELDEPVGRETIRLALKKINFDLT